MSIEKLRIVLIHTQRILAGATKDPYRCSKDPYRCYKVCEPLQNSLPRKETALQVLPWDWS